MKPPGTSEGLTALLGEGHDVPASVNTALAALHEPITNESVDQASGATTAEATTFRNLRRSQAVTTRLKEHQKNLVVLGG